MSHVNTIRIGVIGANQFLDAFRNYDTVTLSKWSMLPRNVVFVTHLALFVGGISGVHIIGNTDEHSTVFDRLTGIFAAMVAYTGLSTGSCRDGHGDIIT